MSNQKINELEEILLNVKDHEIFDKNGTKQTVKIFDFNIVRRFKESDLIIKFKDFKETIDVLDVFIPPTKREKEIKRLVQELKEQHIPENSEINVKIKLV